MLPVKQMVRTREGFGDADRVQVTMKVEPRLGRLANGTGSAT